MAFLTPRITHLLSALTVFAGLLLAVSELADGHWKGWVFLALAVVVALDLGRSWRAGKARRGMADTSGR